MSPFYFRSVLPPHSDPIGGTPLPAHGAVTHNYDWSQWATLESALPKYVIGGWPRYSAGGDWAEVAVPAHDVRENALDRHRLVCVRPVRARPARDGLRLQLHLVRPQRDGDIHAAVVRSTVLPAGPVRTPHPELRDCGHRRRHAFLTITLPQLKPGLVAGSVLVLSRSIAEFGATIIVVSAVLKTAPIAIFTQAEAGSLELASAYSVVLMVVSFVAYLLMSRWLLRGATIA